MPCRVRLGSHAVRSHRVVLQAPFTDGALAFKHGSCAPRSSNGRHVRLRLVTSRGEDFVGGFGRKTKGAFATASGQTRRGERSALAWFDHSRRAGDAAR